MQYDWDLDSEKLKYFTRSAYLKKLKTNCTAKETNNIKKGLFGFLNYFTNPIRKEKKRFHDSRAIFLSRLNQMKSEAAKNSGLSWYCYFN